LLATLAQCLHAEKLGTNSRPSARMPPQRAAPPPGLSFLGPTVALEPDCRSRARPSSGDGPEAQPPPPAEAQPPPLAFPLPPDPVLPPPLRSPPLALPLPLGAVPLPEPELGAGVPPELLLGADGVVVGALGWGTVRTTRTGVGLVGWVLTTGVAVAGRDAVDGVCEVTGCDTVTLCLGFWTRAARCAAALFRCPLLRGAALAFAVRDECGRRVGAPNAGVSDAPDAGLSGAEAMLLTSFATWGAMGPAPELPPERTTKPAPANTEASATEAPSARTGLLRRREALSRRGARLESADARDRDAAAGSARGSPDAAPVPRAARLSAAFGSPRSMARWNAASAGPIRPCSASSTPRLPAAAA
jgi:hypothetical protein